MTKIPLSVLELATVIEGGNHRTAIDNTVKIAQHVENLGYQRIWMAEHHNMEYIASSATSVLIGHVAAKTRIIRAGSGGIMLPNHSPLVIAEQFGTLETIYPGRIDLGLGRAPGSDQVTAMALRRNQETAHSFPRDVRQLQTYFSEDNADAKVRAFPGEGLDIPIWILGSSTDSAYLAAEMGLPYAFASHFAPAQFRAAIKIYRSNFKPSTALQKPYVMACVNVIGADTDDEANMLLSSLLNLFVGIITNTRKPLRPAGIFPESYNIPEVKNAVNNMLSCTFYGSKETLKKNISQFIAETEIDELMVASHIFDLDAKLKSFSILNEALAEI
ncbi:LLM class flavin-dependent oxidoreductase [Lacihabitans sp. CCS-44]|uniref:LLM class flavin-dependent oxidoreductase n=1 Tax=Lacihabitans sp. CCS-44 TaxID=2487331 RepID=UPI0020CDDFC2|nr:LLM class flavin-dependent oxidoreductase [Lacihabitans sp. CCS-44]MCP9755484.1 LLM class flavin-dependent oxidoreductase [Lacihabitans sp. CCS-44]